MIRKRSGIVLNMIGIFKTVYCSNLEDEFVHDHVILENLFMFSLILVRHGFRILKDFDQAGLHGDNVEVPLAMNT